MSIDRCDFRCQENYPVLTEIKSIALEEYSHSGAFLGGTATDIKTTTKIAKHNIQ